MGDVEESHGRADFRSVSQDRDDAAIINFEEGHENKASEQLMLRELLGAEAMSIQRYRFLRRGQGDAKYLPWRLAAAAHQPWSSNLDPRAQVENSGFSTEHF